jgi:hypothetical protein
VNVDLGINSDLSFTVSVTATASGTGSGTIGAVTLGNFTATLDDGADLYGYPLYLYADGNIGAIKAGDLSLSLGVSADATLYHDVYAYKGDIASFTRGDVNLTAGIDSYIWVSDYLNAYTGGSLGDVTIGNVNLSAAKNATASYSLDLFADKTVGNVTIGNVDVTAGAGADANFQAWISGDMGVGNVKVGDVSVVAVGANADARFSATAYASDADSDIGTVTLGNVSMNVNGQDAYGYFWVDTDSQDETGLLTVGDMSLIVGNAAKKTGASLEVDVTSDDGDVTIGNVTLHGSSVRAAGDATMTYSADFYASANGDLKVGNITVTGGDGTADNFATLSNWLSLNGTTISVGTIDYSGYGAAATIDITGFKNVAGVVGSSKADTITAGKQTATEIRGGAGGDTFVFDTAYNAKTLATIHKILDFSNSQGDKINVGVTPTVTTYGEASFGSFDLFVTGANAADKDVFVGLVSGNGFVAIDHNMDGTVDSIIELVGLNSLGNIDVASFV